MSGFPLSRVAALLAWFIVAMMAPPLGATTYCVHDVAELKAAVTASNSNGVSDEIRIRQGTYVLASAISSVGMVAQMHNAESLDISGGWYGDAGACSNILPIAERTRIVTSITINSVQLLVVQIAQDASGDLGISNLAFSAGRASERGGCIYVFGLGTGNSVPIVIDRNHFGACRAKIGAAVEVTASSGSVRVRGNEFIENTAENGLGALVVGTNGSDAFISNNSFQGNLVVAGSISGYVASGSGVHWLTNNLFQSTRTDLYVNASTALVRNIYGSISGTPSVSQQNIVGLPGYVSKFRSDLAANSIARNSGTNSPFGGAMTVDIHGIARPNESTMDRGALEYPYLFGNGFE